MKNEKGVVLVIALMMLLVMTLVMTAMMQTTAMELRLVGNNLSRQQSFWIAEGGLEVAKSQLKTADSVSVFRNLPTLSTPVQLGDGSFTLSIANFDDAKQSVTVKSQSSIRSSNISILESRMEKLYADAPAALYSESLVKLKGSFLIDGGSKYGVAMTMTEHTAIGDDTVTVDGTSGQVLGTGLSPSIKYTTDNLPLAEIIGAFRPASTTLSVRVSGDVDNSDWGTSSNPRMFYMDGYPKLGGVTGYGILMVTGDLEVHGGFDWTGLVIVLGTISFTGGGADKVNIVGGVMCGEMSAPSADLSDFGGSMTLKYANLSGNLLKKFNTVIVRSWEQVH
jgi:hypothetical protein